MIVSVCVNPAIDLTYELAHWRRGAAQRVAAVHERAGGKGVNVARVLAQLGVPAVVLAFAGGGRGDELRADLDRGGLTAELVPIAASTRRTVTVVDHEAATLLSEPGPQIRDAEWKALHATFSELAARAEVVVLSGSLPPGAPNGLYAQLTTEAHRHGATVVVDANGPALRHALDAHPDLVTPNEVEAAALQGSGDAAPVWFVRAGARGAVISLGELGLRAHVGGRRYRVRIGEPVRGNPTGAGDALTAALAAGTLRGAAAEDLLREAVAIAGGAVALPYAGGFDPATADRVRATITVEPEP